MSQLPYGSIATHKWMIQDTVRTALFQEAISKVICGGETVIDVGAGTGILSLFAAQAGARKVYAIERSPMAPMIGQLALANGLADRIEIVSCSVADAVLDEPADVLISEWMGCFGVDEGMLGAVLLARDRWLAGRVIVPQGVACRAVPVSNSSIRDDFQWWSQRQFGLDLSPIHDRLCRESDLFHDGVNPDDFLAAETELWSHDLLTVRAAEISDKISGKARFTCTRQGSLDGIALWFRAQMAGDLVLENHPAKPRTHWGQALFPIAEGRDVTPGDTIDIELSIAPGVPDKPARWRWRLNESDWLEQSSFG